MKHILNVIIVFAIAFTTTNAQTIDKDRMHRDLEVAENALSTVIKTDKDDYPSWPSFGHSDIESGYIKDYGVVFTVEQRNSYHYKKLIKDKDGKSDPKEKFVETMKEEKEHFIQNSKTFLADYAGIIGQLDNEDRISIRRGGSSSNDSWAYSNDFFVIASGESDGQAKTVWGFDKDHAKEMSELLIEVSVGDIRALQRGDMSRDQFFNTVEVISNEISHEKDADLETLCAMFHRLYKKDLSDTYYSERMPKYSKLSNFGATIKMKFYSSWEDNKVYSMPTIDKEGLTLEQRNNYVMELLPKFTEDFKYNLINYGRTLKNLDNDDILLFEINMTTCKGCKDFPRYMKFSVKKSVLHKFNRGKMSMDEAIGMVNVDKLGK